jgi:hypothetical protein
MGTQIMKSVRPQSDPLRDTAMQRCVKSVPVFMGWVFRVGQAATASISRLTRCTGLVPTPSAVAVLAETFRRAAAPRFDVDQTLSVHDQPCIEPLPDGDQCVSGTAATAPPSAARPQTASTPLAPALSRPPKHGEGMAHHRDRSLAVPRLPRPTGSSSIETGHSRFCRPRVTVAWQWPASSSHYSVLGTQPGSCSGHRVTATITSWIGQWLRRWPS